MANTTASLPFFLTQSKSDLHAKFVDLEWQQRQRLNPVPTTSNNPDPFARVPPTAITAARNRYLNVEPFAANRVHLRNVPKGGSDYINASPIVLGEEGGKVGRRRYIATQGPKETNLNHFWRMVWQETEGQGVGVGVVVMLTRAWEGGREKCSQYYPLEASESPLEVPLEGESDGVESVDETAANGSSSSSSSEQGHGHGFEGSVELVGDVVDDLSSRSQHRTLRLHAKTLPDAVPDTKEIHHLLFSGWPDFLVPEGEDRAALLQLVALSARLNRRTSSATAKKPSGANGKLETNGASAANAEDFLGPDGPNPRIIHCSAGVGRSGTFIALDYLLSLLHAGELDLYHFGSKGGKKKDWDPIAETVDALRRQRMMMVQGEGQFMFLYEVLREAWVEKAKENQAGGDEPTSAKRAKIS